MIDSTEHSTSIQIKQLEPWVLRNHKNIAHYTGISLENHIKQILQESAVDLKDNLIKELASHRDRIANSGKSVPESEDLIQNVRAESC